MLNIYRYHLIYSHKNLGDWARDVAQLVERLCCKQETLDLTPVLYEVVWWYTPVIPALTFFQCAVKKK